MKHARVSPYLDSPAKRFCDLLICVVLLVPLSVIMMAVGLVVWIVDGRPVLFKQRRLGKHGRAFWIWKFRTLRPAATGQTFTSEEELEGYVTRTGRFLRPARLDELPQVSSVLFGRMSIVGPRPEVDHIALGYTLCQRKRLLAKPGVTGLWQVMSDRKRPIHEAMKFDLYYLRRASFWLDVRIVFMTIVFLLRLGKPLVKRV